MAYKFAAGAVVVAVAALCAGTSGVSGAELEESWPITVSSMAELIEAAGASDDFGTGVRTTRAAFVSLQARSGKNGGCTVTPNAAGVEAYLSLPEVVTVALADIDAAPKDSDLLDYFKLTREQARGPSCGALGFLQRRTPASKPELLVWTPDSGDSVASWITKRMSVAVEICNELLVDGDTADMEEEELEVKTNDLEIDIWFASPSAGFRQTGFRKMKSGSCQWMATYVGTKLQAKNHATGEVVAEHLVKYSGLFVVHPFEEMSPETCSEIGPRITPATDDETMASRRAAEAARKASNSREPRTLPHFTEVGFKKTRVPEDTWDAIMTYYNDNKRSPKLEMWGKNNVYTNNEEAPSYMVNVPEDWAGAGLKKQIWSGVRPILEEWAGGIELEPTALYGIRIYTNGSWLANHIDTKSTHVISTIINVDQDVTEDWDLEIYDHAGNPHHILMQPRDMVLYESATCVHGRPVPFKGKYFANVFTHFKPVDPALWDEL